jgi:hypothetical protein
VSADAQQQQQQQQEQQVAGVAGDGKSGAVGECVTMTVAALSQLQAAAQHHQRRSNKWKAKCRQLAQHLGVLNAELQHARCIAAGVAGTAAGNAQNAAAAAAAASGVESRQRQQQQHQQAELADATKAIEFGQQEIRQLQQQLMAAQVGYCWLTGEEKLQGSAMACKPWIVQCNADT